MSYENLAYLYDQLMADAPYEQWVKFVRDQLQKYRVKGKTMLDLACGTGELSIQFAEAGFDVTGVDLSADMLAVARAKAEDEGLRIPLYQQDMAELEGLASYDVIGIFCDSLNYLPSEEKVVQTFAKVFQYLQTGGIFLFDVHSIYKVNELFINQTFTVNDDEISYIWNCLPGAFPNSMEHDLSFFVFDEVSGKYDRYDELHQQRTFSIEQYSLWLEAAGFELLEVNADFTTDPPQPKSERIFFTAQKR